MRGSKGLTLSERLWSKVAIGDLGECWRWLGAQQPDGYGTIRSGYQDGNRVLSAHLVVAEWTHGPRPEGLDVLHSCNNRWCLNPIHLSYGTHARNMQQCIEEGRFKFLAPRLGEANNRAKLTESKVLEIRNSSLTNVELSRIYGVSDDTISKARRGLTWKHV